MKFVSAISHFKKRNDMQQKFKSPDALSLVAEFHHLFRHPILPFPAIPSPERCQLRVNLIMEEAKELETAIQENNLVGIADALADLQYVISGAILEFGLGSHFAKIFHEVQRSNMSKAAKTEEEARRTVEQYFQDNELECFIEPRDGRFFVYRRFDKKTVKSIDYSPADIATAMSGEPDEPSELNSTEAIAGFMAWILSPDNKEPVLTIDNAPRLISTFAASQDLPVTRENWRNFLKPMPSNHDDEHSGGIAPEQSPNPGDFSVCWNCGNVAKFGSDLTLVPVASTDLDAFKHHQPEAYDTLMETIAGIRRKNVNKIKS